ncbi:MAG: O-antigen ligase family protein [Pseudomonadota bacterium]
MAHAAIEERLVIGAILSTIPMYFVGGLYVLGPVLGWLLFALVCLRFLHSETFYIPPLVLVWGGCALTLLIALLVAHADYDLGLPKTIKSGVGWAKGWALFALFLGAGMTLSIRPQPLAHAVCWVCAMTIVFLCLSLIALPFIKGHLYTSPLSIIGGAGSEYFEIKLFGMNPETGMPRWSFFAPWAPAAGLVACLYFAIAWHAPNSPIKLIGMTGALLMIIFCQSRVAWVTLPLVMSLLLLSQINLGPGHIVMVAIAVTLAALSAPDSLEYLQSISDQLKNARPDSTRVRAALEQIALDRGLREAPVWGHGIVERGPHLVQYMPIGTHHTWLGLLFLKGLVGVAAFALMLISLLCASIVSIVKGKSPASLLAVILPLLIYTMTENLEMLVYLFWPAIVYIGAQLKSQRTQTETTEQAQDYAV